MPLNVYLAETDGEIKLEEVSISELQEMTKNMDYRDYAVIRGSSNDVLKFFHEREPRSLI